MSIQVSACLNPFSQERKDFSFEQGITVQEIINKIDALHAVNTGWRVMIDDEIITDFERIPQEGQRVYIKLVPEGDNKSAGAGMKIAGGALAALGVIIAACTGWTGIGAGIGVALIGAGIGMFSGGVALYNMNIPNTDREQPEQDPAVRGSRNQLRPYGTVPVLFGKRRIYADLCANPYTWVDSNGVVWLYQLFCVGQKDIQIDNTTIKIGETKITDYSSTDSISRILSTANPDPLIQMQIADGENTPPLYDKCVHEIQLNTLLKHQTEDGQDGAVIRTTPDKTTQLNVDIFFYNGLGKYNDDGEVVDTSVTVKAEYKRSDQSDSAYTLLGYFSSGSNEITGHELKTKRYAITKSNLTAASYTVRITRVSEDSTDTKIVDSVYVGSIRAAKSVQPVRTERCRQLTLVGLKIKSSEKLNGIVEQLNFLAQSKLPTYNSQNSTWSNALSCNPASAAMYAMQGEVAQQKLENSEIDKASFERLFTWCASNSYECNAYICEDMSISSLLSAIGSTCRAEILKINSKITVIQDIARDSYVQLFTPRNSFDFKETMALSDVPDEMKMGFVDKDSGYAENEASVYNTPTGNKQSGVEPATSQSVPLWGVTDKNQALKIGMYNYAVSNHRFAVVKFSCDFEYLMCRKGDWIKYAGDIALAGLKQGRIVSVQDMCIELDEEVTMEAGKSYAIRIRHKDGSAEIRSVVTAAGTSLTVTVTGSSFENPSELEGCLFTFGEAGNDSRDLIVTDIQCGENLSADLICVDYAPEIFGVDEPGFVLPDFVNNLSETDGAIDSGQITQSEWRTFFTYHDGTGQPTYPTGDGTNDGWHLTKTPESVWVSSKTAKSIYEGDWSAPADSRGRDGIPGTPGINTYTLSLFKKASEAPQNLPASLTYNFSTGAITCSNLNGWQSYIPPVDEEKEPTWEIHATVTSTSSTGTIATSDWSSPNKILEEGLSKQDVIDLIGERINETPNVIFTPSGGTFAVDEDGIVSVQQTSFMDVRVIQNNEDLDFTFGQISLPAGISVEAMPLREGTRLLFTAAPGTRLGKSIITVPVNFVMYLDNDVLVDEDGNPLVWVANEDGRWYGEISTVASLPSAVSGGFIYWKGSDTQSTEEVVVGGVFEQGTFYTYNGTKWAESQVVPLGINTEASDTTTYDIFYEISIMKGGRYEGGINAVANIPANPVIGDYFVWTGTNNTSFSGSGFSYLNTSCIYKWNGNQWEKDTSKRHLGNALPEILMLAEALVEANNSDIVTMVQRMIAWEVVTQNIKVTGEAIIDSTITSKLVLGTNPDTQEDSYIESSNYSESENTGFRINADGSAVFNNVKVRGDIEATSLTAAVTSSLNSTAQGYASTAQSNAVSTAASDASSKASTAESNAKDYADGLKTAVDTNLANNYKNNTALETWISGKNFASTSDLDAYAKSNEISTVSIGAQTTDPITGIKSRIITIAGVGAGSYKVQESDDFMTFEHSASEDLTVVSAQPADWATSYKKYFERTGTSGNYIYTSLADKSSAPAWSGHVYCSAEGKKFYSVNKNGLLVCSNAIVWGTVYATNGSFTGDITANSFTLGANAGITKGTDAEGSNYFGLDSTGKLRVRNLEAVGGHVLFSDYCGTLNSQNPSVGDMMIYMGQNPRLLSATREFQFAISQYLGKAGQQEMWSDKLITKFLAGGLLALNLVGCVQTTDAVYSKVGETWKKAYVYTGDNSDSSDAIVSGNPVDGKYIFIKYDFSSMITEDFVNFSVDDTLKNAMGANNTPICAATFNDKYILVTKNNVAYTTNFQTWNTVSAITDITTNCTCGFWRSKGILYIRKNDKLYLTSDDSLAQWQTVTLFNSSGTVLCVDDYIIVVYAKTGGAYIDLISKEGSSYSTERISNYFGDYTYANYLVKDNTLINVGTSGIGFAASDCKSLAKEVFFENSDIESIWANSLFYNNKLFFCGVTSDSQNLYSVDVDNPTSPKLLLTFPSNQFGSFTVGRAENIVYANFTGVGSDSCPVYYSTDGGETFDKSIQPPTGTTGCRGIVFVKQLNLYYAVWRGYNNYQYSHVYMTSRGREAGSGIISESKDFNTTSAAGNVVFSDGVAFKWGGSNPQNADTVVNLPAIVKDASNQTAGNCIKFANGLMIQWGQTDPYSVSAGGSISIPIRFGNLYYAESYFDNCYSVQLTQSVSASGMELAVDNSSPNGTPAKDKDGFIIKGYNRNSSTSISNCVIHWLTIGNYKR